MKNLLFRVVLPHGNVRFENLIEVKNFLDKISTIFYVNFNVGKEWLNINMSGSLISVISSGMMIDGKHDYEKINNPEIIFSSNEDLDVIEKRLYEIRKSGKY